MDALQTLQVLRRLTSVHGFSHRLALLSYPRCFESSINVSLRIFSCLNVIWHRMGLLLSRREDRTVCSMADACPIFHVFLVVL
jgi:hypothetical protein